MFRVTSARRILSAAFSLSLLMGLVVLLAVPAAAQPSLEVTKTFTDDQVMRGTAGHTFTIDVANTLTEGNASNVVVTDSVDPRLTVTGASGTDTPDVPGADWDCSATLGNDVSCALALLAAGETGRITVTYFVPFFTAPGTIPNSASAVSVEQTTPVTGSDSVDVVSLQVTKTFADDQVTAGTTGHTFTIDVTIPFMVDVTDRITIPVTDNVVVTDSVDPRLTVTGASGTDTPDVPGTAWDCSATSGNDVSCTLALLAPRARGFRAGVTGEITVTYDVPFFTAPGTIHNSASAVSVEQTTPVTGSDSVDVVARAGPRGGADLSVVKSASSDATVGSPLTYTITVHNAGPNAATGVKMTDTLPPGVAFVSATSGVGTCSQASGTVTCNIGSLAVNGSVTITIVVTPTAAGDITNTAYVKGTTSDPTSTNNTATLTSTVVAPKHARQVSLRPWGSSLESLRPSGSSLEASGRVTVSDGFAACASGVPVKIQKWVSGIWTTLKSMMTSSTGTCTASLPNEAGTYRTLAPRVKVQGEICARATSPTRRI